MIPICQFYRGIVMKKDEIIIGKTFYDWKILTLPFRKNDRYFSICRCKCGVEKEVDIYSLMRGETQRCQKCSSKVAFLKQKETSWIYKKMGNRKPQK